jgi:hypothetical protein
MSRRTMQGFTLLELTVVMGLLAGFLLFLTQLLSGGVSLFQEGETGQELADVANVAARAAEESLGDMIGPAHESYEPGPPDARLLLQWVPLGLAQQAGTARVQALRATVRLDPWQEEDLLRALYHKVAEEAPGSRAPEEVEKRLAELVDAAPRRGRGDMLLLPWPAGDPEGAFLELRRAVLLPGQTIEVGAQRRLALFDVEQLEQLPAQTVRGLSTPVATGLLHFELAFWSQLTRKWEALPAEGGPESVWDSARAGWLSADTTPGSRFTLDRIPGTLLDTTDDVFPRRLRVTLVVDRSGPEALLAEPMGPEAVEATLISIDRLPGIEEASFVKIGDEWVRHAGVSGNSLTGLRRGERHTPATAHPQGTKVRIGKTVELFVELAHGRDCWNE